MADKRQLILDLLARDKTGPATKSAAGNLDDVAESAGDAAKASEKLGKESDRAEDQVERLGKSSRTAAQHVDRLDREIESVERELRQLAVAFAEAETAADRLDLSKAIRRTEGDLKKLNKSKGLLAGMIPEPAEMVDAAAEVSQGFLKSLKANLEANAGPIGAGVMGGLVASGVALAPALGATVAAAILGGAGVGGVVGGLKLAARDDRVKASAKQLGKEVMASLDEAAGAFVPAALKGIDQVRGSFKRISGDLKGIFDSSAGYVGPLIKGVTGLVENAIGGAGRAVAAAKPVIDVLSTSLPELGTVIGDVLDSLSDNGPEAAAALQQVFHVIEGGVIVVGGLVNALTEAYGFLARTGVLGDEAQRTWQKYSKETKNATGAASGFADGQQILASETKKGTKEIDIQREALVKLGKEERARVDPLFRFVEAQKGVTKAQKEYTEAVNRYGKDSDQAREKLRALTGSALDLSDAADQVGATADGKLSPALQRALQKAGLTKGEIAGVRSELARTKGEFDKYGRLSPVAHVFANTAGADGPLRRTAALLAKIRSKSVSVHVGVSGATAAIDLGKILGRRAAGGPVTAGQPYIVGEKRPEVFVPDQNGRVEPSIQRFAGGGGIGQGAGPQEVRVVIDVRGAETKFGQLLLSMLSTQPGVARSMSQVLGVS